MLETIGMVGVGRMGANMARRLKEAGFTLTCVHDLNRESAASLAAELGVEAAPTLARVTALSSVILTVVTNDDAMRSIFLGTGDRLLRSARGRLFINCATLSPAVHEEVEKACKRTGASVLEACMASSIPQARQGTLYLMCGGSETAFDRAKPILTALSDGGKLLRHIGGTGKAAQVKALVNMVMNINTAGLAEGLGLGAALGLDVTMLREVFSQTGAGSRVLLTDGEDMQNREHSCYFSAEHAAKDSGIALALGKALGLNLPLAAATEKQYLRLVKAGLGHLDKSGVAELTFPGRAPAKRSRSKS
jgi:3-hydroxyisobutyrate dehydrogenase-like beta-hydroxyacid dehydrogenase